VTGEQSAPGTGEQSAAAPPRSLIGLAGFWYFPIALIARLPFAMMVVGMLTLVVAERHSLGLGGLTSAAAGAGTAIFGALLGAAADRWGQRRVLLITAVVNSAALVTLVLVVASPAPDILVLVVAFVIGSSAPQVSPMSRSRLVGIVGHGFAGARRDSVLSGTMSYESAADEIVFVFGPVIVGVLATVLTPASPVLGAALLTFMSVIAFALHPSARAVTPTGGHHALDQAPARELFAPAVLVVLAGALGVGLYFGSTLTSLTSFMTDRGIADQVGIVYGAQSVSSAAFALGAAWFPRRFTLAARWIVFAGILLLGTGGLLFVQDVVGAAVVLFVMGIGLGPTLVGLYHLGAERSPRGRSATVMTMLGSSMIVGQAIAAATTGAVAQSHGTAAAMIAPVVAVAVVFVAALVNARVP
jgi:MFS family permease